MAKTMRIDNTNIYRTVVELRRVDGSILTRVYGPHDSKSQNKDYGGYGFSADSPRRITKQQLAASLTYVGSGESESELEWHTYSVTYKNGGEDVDWGE